MKRVDDIDREVMKDFLGKGWLTHDGMWFYHTCLDCGIQTANRLNRQAIKTLSAIEMARAKKVLEVAEGDLDTFAGLRDFMHDSLKLILPASIFSRADFTFRDPNIIHWEWEDGECFAYKGMQQLGVLDEYLCGVIYRIQCWFENLGIPYEVKPKIEKCIMHETGSCKGDFAILLPAPD